jgi:hypothetical protein
LLNNLSDRKGPGVSQVNSFHITIIKEAIDSWTTNLAEIEVVGIGKSILTTTVKKDIDLGINFLPSIGDTVDLGTL